MFRLAGAQVATCDLLPSEIDYVPHFQGDCKHIQDQGWDLVIGHPPCTWVSKTGLKCWVRLRVPQGLYGRSARSMAADMFASAVRRRLACRLQQAACCIYICALSWQVKGCRASRARTAGLQGT
eukprot:scaffold24495_cov111-Isochrysis_galbana.AAC.4